MIRAWIARHIIADDPHEPEYSRLGRMDGLVQQPSGLWIDEECFDQMAHRMFGEAA